jgi:hypothetical protein
MSTTNTRPPEVVSWRYGRPWSARCTGCGGECRLRRSRYVAHHYAGPLLHGNPAADEPRFCPGSGADAGMWNGTRLVPGPVVALGAAGQLADLTRAAAGVVRFALDTGLQPGVVLVAHPDRPVGR